MANVFFLIFAITLCIGINADSEVNKKLEMLLQRCTEIEGYTVDLRRDLNSRRRDVDKELARSRNLVDQECVERISNNHNRIIQLINERSYETSELNNAVAETRRYVNNIKNKGERYIVGHKQEIIGEYLIREPAMFDKVIQAKKMYTKFVPEASTPYAEFIFIQNCLH